MRSVDLRAKIGGLRQLYALAVGQVSRPIPTPIHGGTISRELCEGCHAADQNRGYKALTRTYFLAGEDVTPVRLAMMDEDGESIFTDCSACHAILAQDDHCTSNRR